MEREALFRSLTQAVIDGNSTEAEELARKALELGIDPLDCIHQGLTKGIEHVGELFAEGEYFLPDLIISANAMKAAMAILEPVMVGDQQRQVLGKVVLGTVKGDLHEIGKTLVGTMLAANGFQVTDLGVDIAPEAFLEAVQETEATLVGASALLTTTMEQQKHLLGALKDAGLRGKVKVMIGGAPVTQEWADKIGADGYAEDAIEAVALAKKLIGA
jgi:corrinoid protein of di/trimethylamine methyltransferase